MRAALGRAGQLARPAAAGRWPRAARWRCWRRPRAALWLLLPRAGALLPLAARPRADHAALLAADHGRGGAAGRRRCSATLGARRARTPARWLVARGAGRARAAQPGARRRARRLADATTRATGPRHGWRRTCRPGRAPRSTRSRRSCRAFAAASTATFVPIAERTRAGAAARGPTCIVTSSASHKSITHTLDGGLARRPRDLLTAAPAAVDMFGGARSGRAAVSRCRRVPAAATHCCAIASPA